MNEFELGMNAGCLLRVIISLDDPFPHEMCDN